MAVTTYAGSTSTASVGTELFLSSVGTTGVFVCRVNCSSMADGDIVELRAYQTYVQSGVALECGFESPGVPWIVYGAQATHEEHKTSYPISVALTTAANPLRFSLKQTFGTARNFEWDVVRHD
jgi:hypothetical protein